MGLLSQSTMPSLIALLKNNLVHGLVLLFCFVFWTKMFRFEDGNIVAQTVPIWGDWALHANIVSGFAYKPPALWFLHHPVYYGEPFSYPFLADFISSIFMRLGFNIVDAFVIPSALTTFLFYLVVKRLFFLIIPSMATKIGFMFFIVLFIFGVGNLSNKVLVPQRSMLLGLVFALYVVGSIHRHFSVVAGPKREIFLLGLFGGLTMLTHPHSLAVLALTSFCYGLVKRQFSKLLFFTLGLFLTAYPLYLIFYSNSLSGVFFGKISPPFSNTLFIDGPWLFFVMLSVLGCLVTGNLKHPLIISAWLVLLLCGFIRFQPWEWDNTKLLVYASLYMNVFIAIFIADLIARNRKSVLLIFILIPLLTYSSIAQWFKDLAPGNKGYTLWSETDLKFVEDFRSIVRPDALVLVQSFHNNPVANLSGRQILMGYDGWLWSYGINYYERKSEVDKFYLCDGEASMFDKWPVDYVVFRVPGCDNYKYLKLVMHNDNYWIYRVNRGDDV